MRSDPKIFSALVADLLEESLADIENDDDLVRHGNLREPIHLTPERKTLLLELGLNERDLAYMGSRQRAMVENILREADRAANAA